MTAEPTNRTHPLSQDPAAIRLVREQKGWSQALLAREAGISRPMLCYIEHGKRDASVEVLDRIAAALECPRWVLEKR